MNIPRLTAWPHATEESTTELLAGLFISHRPSRSINTPSPNIVILVDSHTLQNQTTMIRLSSSLARRTLARTVLRATTAATTVPRPPVTMPSSYRSFADDSHNDFAPQRKTVTTDQDEIQTMIQQHVTENKIMLYMKGTPSMPMCGFSAKVVGVLQAEGVDFSSVNVLDYPSIREGIKIYSDWPTIPQLYVNGEFIGGCDIVVGMHENGELKEVLAES